MTKIVLRLKEGWSETVNNKSRTLCDKCGAKLWVAPHGKKYCDEVHEGKFPKPKVTKEKKLKALRAYKHSLDRTTIDYFGFENIVGKTEMGIRKDGVLVYALKVKE